MTCDVIDLTLGPVAPVVLELNVSPIELVAAPSPTVLEVSPSPIDLVVTPQPVVLEITGVGVQGSPGAAWRNGDGAPSNTLGIDGDFYLDRLTGDVYQKAAGVYSVVTNITGPQGIQGVQGDVGPTGATGATGPNSVTTSTTTNITGLIKGNGTNVLQATAGTDYLAPSAIIDTAHGGLGANNSAASGVPIATAGTFAFLDYLNQAVKTTSSPTFAGETIQNNVNGDSTQLLIDNANATGGSGLRINRASNARAAQIQFSLAGTTEWWLGELRSGGSASTTFSIGRGSDITTTAPSMNIATSGLVGWSVRSPTYNMSFEGTATKTIGVERNTITNTAGAGWNLFAGNATLGATDKNGGDVALVGGVSTGTGSSNILLRVCPPAASTGTADNVVAEAARFTGSGFNFLQGTTTVPTAATYNHVMGGGPTSPQLPTAGLTDVVSKAACDTAAGDRNEYSINEAAEIERITGRRCRVTTDFARTSTVTLANVTGLTRNVEAGRKYSFRAVLDTSSNTGGGVKVAIGGTCTATHIWYRAVVTEGLAIVAHDRATALGTAVGGVTAVASALIVIEGEIVINAAGTLTVQFAPNASIASASTVLTGSNFEIKSLAA